MHKIVSETTSNIGDWSWHTAYTALKSIVGPLFVEPPTNRKALRRQRKASLRLNTPLRVRLFF